MNNELRISTICTCYCDYFEMKECEVDGKHGMDGVKKNSYKMFGKPHF
jgi:hypothetical protein